MTSLKAFIVQKLEESKGDGLERALHTFESYTPADMVNSEYGASGQTPAQIIEGYRQERARIDAAIAWVKAQE